MTEVFKEYTDSFTKLPIAKKQKEIVYELKLITTFLNKLNVDFDNDKELLLNKELLHMSAEQVSESDYLDTVFVLVQSLKNELGKYMDEVISNLYKKY